MDENLFEFSALNSHHLVFFRRTLRFSCIDLAVNSLRENQQKITFSFYCLRDFLTHALGVEVSMMYERRGSIKVMCDSEHQMRSVLLQEEIRRKRRQSMAVRSYPPDHLFDY